MARENENIFLPGSPNYGPYEAWVKNGGLERIRERKRQNARTEGLKEIRPQLDYYEINDSGGESLRAGRAIVLRKRGRGENYRTLEQVLKSWGCHLVRETGLIAHEGGWGHSTTTVWCTRWLDQAGRIQAVDIVEKTEKVYTGDILKGLGSMHSQSESQSRTIRVARELVQVGQKLEIISTKPLARAKRRLWG
ncbi:MAG: hypothetical protein WC686_02730 [Candidatus Shapirobacteria bacterium]|jgi:hypothetical protein